MKITMLVRAICIAALAFYSGILPAGDRPAAPDHIAGATSVSAEQVIELVLADPALLIIDARKKTEYVKGHIEGAISMLNTSMEREGLEAIAPDHDRPILFYCNGVRCLRSSDSVRKAMGWGYTNLFWFRGGWKEWTDKRFPVITD